MRDVAVESGEKSAAGKTNRGLSNLGSRSTRVMGNAHTLALCLCTRSSTFRARSCLELRDTQGLTNVLDGAGLLIENDH